jgi:glycerol-3-phosphate dehydrogenase
VLHKIVVNRSESLIRLQQDQYDVLVIGGGATGLGVALDSAARGYRTALVTSGDFAQATSSRSTKLIHGGVRYLEQGNVWLVREALRERALLLRNAPNLVKPLRMIIPAYNRRQMLYYGAGLKTYDALAGQSNILPSRILKRDRVLDLLPGITSGGLRGGVAFSDAQFNDARLALALMKTSQAHGAVVANYLGITSLLKTGERLSGAVARDQETGQEYIVRARTVVNATGIFTDQIRRMDDPEAPSIISLSRGSHIVVGDSFLPGKTGILVPRTEDRRVVFILPWEGRALIGTTDVPVDRAEMEPVPSEEEIWFLLRHAATYLDRPPAREDILSAYAGLRPLVRAGSRATSRLSRGHAILTSRSGLVTITGGKWTTYRKMSEDAVTRAAEVGGLPLRACPTSALRLVGSDDSRPDWRETGAGASEITEYDSQWSGMLSPRLPYSLAMTAYVIDREMPVHLDDVLSRRLRALVLDSEESIALAPKVADLMASRQGRSATWASKEIDRYTRLAARYAGAPAIL